MAKDLLTKYKILIERKSASADNHYNHKWILQDIDCRWWDYSALYIYVLEGPTPEEVAMMELYDRLLTLHKDERDIMLQDPIVFPSSYTIPTDIIESREFTYQNIRGPT